MDLGRGESHQDPMEPQAETLGLRISPGGGNSRTSIQIRDAPLGWRKPLFAPSFHSPLSRTFCV